MVRVGGERSLILKGFSELGASPPQATKIQSQLFSVGFDFSGLSLRHAGFRAVLRVPRVLRWNVGADDRLTQPANFQ